MSKTIARKRSHSFTTVEENEAHSCPCRGDRCLGSVVYIHIGFSSERQERKPSLAHGSLKKFLKREKIT